VDEEDIDEAFDEEDCFPSEEPKDAYFQTENTLWPQQEDANWTKASECWKAPSTKREESFWDWKPLPTRLDDEVNTLVNKILSPNAPKAIVSTSLLNVLSNRKALQALCHVLQDDKVQQSLVAISNAEISAVGDGVKLAKIHVLTQFAPMFAELISLYPCVEPLLLSLLVPTTPPPVVEDRFTHVGVSCDRCDSNVAFATASVEQGFRDALQLCIVGNRFKSTTVANFDLCEACEASMEYQESHGPFLKLVNGKQNPSVICCIDGDGSASLEKHLELINQPKLAKEFAEFRKSRVQSIPASPVVTQPITPKVAPMDPPPRVRKCVHVLKAFETQHGGYTCDECHFRVPVKTQLYGCRPCNYDVCEACHALTSSPAVVTVAPSVVSPPQAKFVCDVTLADGSVVRPGEKLVKTWRIRNSGEVAWERGTKIMHVGGDSLGGPMFGVEVPVNVKPGDAVNVSVDLVMPMTPGRYTSYWRLTTPLPTSAKFGHRFWVTVNVVPVRTTPPPPPPPPMPVVNAATEEDDDFSMSVAKIVDFGFTDVDKVVRVLREEKYDVGRTIDRLLQE